MLVYGLAKEKFGNLQLNSRISFDKEVRKNINSRCGIACFFSRRARLENLLYEQLEQHTNNDGKVIINLQQLQGIIDHSSGCGCGSI